MRKRIGFFSLFWRGHSFFFFHHDFSDHQATKLVALRGHVVKQPTGYNNWNSVDS